MKKFIILAFIFSLFSHQQTVAQQLRSEALFDLTIDLNPPQFVGSTPKGIRLISPFKDGFVKGDKINGKLLVSSSADWGLILDSNTFKIESRATIETEDSALIYISYSGYSYATAKTAALIGAGRVSELSPSDYYFRTTVSFETGAPRYAWLNHTVGIGVGRFPAAGKVAFRVYAIQ